MWGKSTRGKRLTSLVHTLGPAVPSVLMSKSDSHPGWGFGAEFLHPQRVSLLWGSVNLVPWAFQEDHTDVVMTN